MGVPICMKYRPLRRLSRSSGPQQLKASLARRCPNQYKLWSTFTRTTRTTFCQKYIRFGLSIAEATVLYKAMFPIWAPLEFMYIVRSFKKERSFMDMLPTPQSINEYTESYSGAKKTTS